MWRGKGDTVVNLARQKRAIAAFAPVLATIVRMLPQVLAKG
jgi:hypothetical protein